MMRRFATEQIQRFNLWECFGQCSLQFSKIVKLVCQNGLPVVRLHVLGSRDYPLGHLSLVFLPSTSERFFVELFNLVHFRVRQLCEFTGVGALRKSTLSLLQEPVQQVHFPLRHVYDLLYSIRESIVSLKVRHFLRKVPFDRLFNTFVEKLGVRSGVEIAVIVSRFI